jgi:hypothetical protein
MIKTMIIILAFWIITATLCFLAFGSEKSLKCFYYIVSTILFLVIAAGFVSMMVGILYN